MWPLINHEQNIFHWCQDSLNQFDCFYSVIVQSSLHKFLQN